ncbi:hypothetical protein GGU10DRAFT_354983, partial [Lentinula aff. detonsa]
PFPHPHPVLPLTPFLCSCLMAVVSGTTHVLHPAYSHARTGQKLRPSAGTSSTPGCRPALPPDKMSCTAPRSSLITALRWHVPDNSLSGIGLGVSRG